MNEELVMSVTNHKSAKQMRKSYGIKRQSLHSEGTASVVDEEPRIHSGSGVKNTLALSEKRVLIALGGFERCLRQP